MGQLYLQTSPGVYTPITVIGGTGSGGSGSSTFIGLTDVPATFVGSGSKVVSVNAGETALEFTTASGGSFATDFAVTCSADTDLTVALTHYQIQFDTVVRDTNSEWVAANKNWKCKTAGKYLCGFTVRYESGTTGYRTAYFRVNGAAAATTSKGVSDSACSVSGHKFGYCTMFDFSVNDTLDVTATSSTNTQIVTLEATEFWVIRYK
jgi:hypothetical protein